MDMIRAFSDELAQEALTTRKMLAIVPAEKFDWRPHPKSMTLKALSAHVGELPGWIALGLTTDGLDFEATPYQPKDPKTTADLLAYFEESLAAANSQLSMAKEEILSEPWILRNGTQIYQSFTKGSIIRHSLSQLIHHRAQLGVFLRLLDIPIPASYGPSADDTGH